MAKRQLKPGNMLYPVPAALVSCTDGAGNTALLHTHDRENTIEDQELHHKFTLANRVQIERPANIKIEQVEEFNTYVQESGD